MSFDNKLIEVFGIANFILFLAGNLSDYEYDRLKQLKVEYFDRLVCETYVREF
jgi:hypothetical protein